MRRPLIFFRMVHTLNRYKLMHPGVLRFAAFQMNSPAKRLKIYKSWTGFRLLTFEIPAIINLLNQHRIPVIMFFGHFDKIITAEAMKFFTSAVENCQVVTLKTGHSHLLEAVGKYLQEHPDLQR